MVYLGMGSRIFTDQEEQEIAKIYKSGISTRAIARIYGLSGKTVVIAALKRTGTKQRSPAERNRKHYIDPHTFDVIDTQEKAYWWGFIYADGYVGRERSLAVTLKRSDINHLIELKTFLKAEHPVKRCIQKTNGKGYPTAQFYATDQHLGKRLVELGITVRRKEFFKVKHNLPSELAQHWIRGVFDGDGHVSTIGSRRPEVNFSGNIEMLRFIREALHEGTGLRADQLIYKHSFADLTYLAYTGRLQDKAIGEFLYKNATIYLERKWDRFQKFNIEPKPLKRNKKGQFVKN